MPSEEKNSFGEKLSSCGHFCYNSETGQVLGRTASSWLKIVVFYMFYYGALAGFFAVCMTGFFATLDSQRPTQRNMQSLLKQSPGMGFRPFTDVTKTVIKFNAKNPKEYEAYVKNLNESIRIYTSSAGDNVVDCSGSNAGSNNKGDSEVCGFPVSLLGDRCTPDKEFGYPEGKPCVLLKINKVYGWKPQTFDNETEDLPDTMAGRIDPDYVGVTCDGESEADKDNTRNITFYPDKGFPAVYYPYLNQPGYLAPVVMAQFDVEPGRLLMFWCRAWARNIKHHRVDLQGSVRFEIMVDY